MFKPFETDIQNFEVTVSTEGFAAPVNAAPHGLTFDIGQFYAPEIASSAAPIFTDGDVVELLASAAVTAAEDNGHVFKADVDGCACCGHDHGGQQKQSIKTIAENLKAAIADGLISMSPKEMFEFLAIEVGLEASDIVDAIKANPGFLGAEVPTTLYMDAPGNSSTSFTLDIGGSVEGTTSSPTDADWYQVDLVAGQTYTFIMLRDGANPHEDPLLRLISTNGSTELAVNDDIDSDGDGQGDNQNSMITYTATVTGTYYVSAQGFDTAEGDYTIYAEEGNDRPDFTLDQSAFFLTHQFSTYAAWNDTNISYDVSSLSAGAQTLALLAMDAWAEVSGITFTEFTNPTGVADLRFQDTEDGAYAQAFQTNGNIYRSVVNVSSDWNGGDLDINSYTFQTYIHEVGHALGLGHGGPYNGNASYDVNRVYNQDAWNYTVMSYFDQGEAGEGTPRLVLGLQTVDLIAIQSLYGTNATGTRAADTVYGFNVTADVLNSVFDFENTFDDNGIRPPSLSIYDTDGEDTLDFSGWNTNQTISLVQETFSSIGDNTNTGATDDALENVISVARGTDLENVISGGGDDIITGNALDNEITGGAGDDTIDGGDGTDIAIYSGNQSAYTVTDNGDGTYTITGGSEGTDTLSNIETIRYADGDVTLGAPPGPTFTEGADVADGSEDDDVLSALGGNDTVNGLGGNDTINGNAGDDTLYGNANNDTLNGGDGIDTLYGGSQNDTLYGDAGADVLYGETGNDTLYGGLDNDTVNGGTGNDFLYGDAGNDMLYGDDGTDWLFGGSQNDILDGGLGADEMTGGTGNDIYYVDNVGDDVIELAGAGYDIVNTTLNTYLLTIGDNIERVNFQGTGNFVTRGNEGDNRFTGAAGNDRFILDSGGSDIFSGGSGRDAFDARSSSTGIILHLEDQSLHAGDVAGDIFASIESFFGSNTAGDYMQTGAARARFSGFGGDDTLVGGASVDFLQGGADNDDLFGNAARDTLQGGTGNDMMTGGADRDQFLFIETSFGQDTILDYEDGLDYLKIFSTVADDISDFTIVGNGTSSVVLTLNDGTGNNVLTLLSDDGSTIDITAADFVFYG